MLYFLSAVSSMNRSSVTGVFSGAPMACQSGISSLIALGSITAPDRMCAPISEPFSSTQTLISRWPFAASCFSLIAADSPAGPPPTTTTSYSITSRGIASSSRLLPPDHYNYVLRGISDDLRSQARARRFGPDTMGRHGRARARQQYDLLPVYGAGACG